MQRHVCARCGRHDTADRMVWSSWTRMRYCADLKACAKRAARRDKAETPVYA